MKQVIHCVIAACISLAPIGSVAAPVTIICTNPNKGGPVPLKYQFTFDDTKDTIVRTFLNNGSVMVFPATYPPGKVLFTWQLGAGLPSMYYEIDRVNGTIRDKLGSGPWDTSNPCVRVATPSTKF